MTGTGWKASLSGPRPLPAAPPYPSPPPLLFHSNSQGPALVWGKRSVRKQTNQKNQSDVFGRLAADVLTCSLSLSVILSFGPFGFSFFVFCVALLFASNKNFYFSSLMRGNKCHRKKKKKQKILQTIYVINFAPQQSKIYYCGKRGNLRTSPRSAIYPFCLLSSSTWAINAVMATERLCFSLRRHGRAPTSPPAAAPRASITSTS